jgi:hypothetical protein
MEQDTHNEQPDANASPSGARPRVKLNADNEVDLSEVMGKIGSFLWRAGERLFWLIKIILQALLRVVSTCFAFVVRSFWWFVGVSAVALLLVVVMNKTQKVYYRSDIVAHMNVGDNPFAVKYINDLGNSANSDTAWVQVLGIPDTGLSKKIKSIGAFWGVDYNGDGVMDVIDIKNQYNRRVVRDSTWIDEFWVLRDRFYIVVNLYSSDVLPYVAQGIVDKFNTNPYLIKEKELSIAAIESNIDAIDRQITLLDSLQRYEYFTLSKEEDKNTQRKKNLFIQPQGQMIEFTDRDQRLLHNEALPLYNSRVTLQAQLKRIQETPMIELMQDGTGVMIRQSNLKKIVLVNFGVLYLLLTLFLLWKENRQRLREYTASVKKVK